METSENQIELKNFHVGAKLIVQCKKDWRTAVVSFVGSEKITLIICSPSGRTYRKSCAVETVINIGGAIPFLGEGIWRETLCKYDPRW